MNGGPAAPRVAGLVLAAGAGSRAAPADKLLHPLGGVPVLVRAVSALLAVPALGPVFVVIDPVQTERKAALAGLPVKPVLAPGAAAGGLSLSLRAGLAALPADGAGFLVALGDMPYVRSLTIIRLLEAFAASGGAEVCVPVYEGRRGNPVLWPAAFQSPLMTLRGDRGGRSLLAECPWRAVPVADSGVVRDLDTAAELAGARWPA